MAEVQKREGLVCICAECKRIIRVIGCRESEDAHLISHGICPACAEKLYGHLFRKGESPGGPAARRGDGAGA